MNMATMFYVNKDLEDISAYYQSLDKPALNPPYLHIKVDEELDSAITSAPVQQQVN
jgi:hypothetical protein